jgi:hypothetical protein
LNELFRDRLFWLPEIELDPQSNVIRNPIEDVLTIIRQSIESSTTLETAVAAWMDRKDFRVAEMGQRLQKGVLRRGFHLSGKGKTLVPVALKDLDPFEGLQAYAVRSGEPCGNKTDPFHCRTHETPLPSSLADDKSRITTKA